MRLPRLPENLRWWYIVLLASIFLLLACTVATVVLAYYLAFVKGPISLNFTEVAYMVINAYL